MICLAISVHQSGLDLHVERQTLGLLRTRAEVLHASRQAGVFASHGAFAVEHVSAMRGSPSGRTRLNRPGAVWPPETRLSRCERWAVGSGGRLHAVCKHIQCRVVDPGLHIHQPQDRMKIVVVRNALLGQLALEAAGAGARAGLHGGG